MPTQRPNDNARLIGVGFICCGVFGTTLGAAQAYSTWHRLSSWTHGTGKVVGYADRKGIELDDPTTYALVVEFQVHSTPYRIQGHNSSTSRDYPLGHMLNVRYPEEDPSEAVIDSLDENWTAALVFGGGGMIFFVIGVGIYRRRRPATFFANRSDNNGNKNGGRNDSGNSSDGIPA